MSLQVTFGALTYATKAIAKSDIIDIYKRNVQKLKQQSSSETQKDGKESEEIKATLENAINMFGSLTHIASEYICPEKVANSIDYANDEETSSFSFSSQDINSEMEEIRKSVEEAQAQEA